MRRSQFSSMQFAHAVLNFIDCDLTDVNFSYCCFVSDAIFEDCILGNTTFTYINGLVTNSHKVSFTGSKTDKTNFDSGSRSCLQSSGKIT